MIINPDTLALTLAGIKTTFDAAYQKAQDNSQWSKVADVLPTTLPVQTYAWLGHSALMQAYVDEAQEQDISQYTYTVTDATWKALERIDRRTIEDDQYGLIMRHATNLANEPMRHWNYLVFTALVNGFSSTCYDGKNFFANNHSEGLSGTQSNTVSTTLNDANLEIAEAAMMAFVDDKGIPMGITPDTLVVGPKLARRAWNLVGQGIVVKPVGSDTAGTGATASTPYGNYFQGRYNVVVSPYITNYNWFLLDTTRGLKPIFIQSRSDVPISFETDMLTPDAMLRERFRIAVRGRYQLAYGMWQSAYGSSASS